MKSHQILIFELKKLEFHQLIPPASHIDLYATGEQLPTPLLTDLLNRRTSNSGVITAYLSALRISVDRYFTALDSGDLASAALQRNAILAYGDALALLFEDAANVTESLLVEMQNAGLPNVELTEADVIALQNQLTSNGFSAEFLQILAEWTATRELRLFWARHSYEDELSRHEVTLVGT